MKNHEIEKLMSEWSHIINRIVEKIKVPGYEAEDILQEGRLAALCYIDFCHKNNEEPNPAAASVSISRHFYRLIRNHVTFEGCSKSTRKTRKMLAQASSNFVQHGENISDSVDMFDYIQSKEETPYIQVMTEELIQKFELELTKTEVEIFRAMLAGSYRPRHICEYIHGSHTRQQSKTISNHCIKIKKKFAEFLENVS